VTAPWYERVGAWFRRWWGALVTGLVLVFGVIGAIFVRRQQLALGAARDDAAVAEARRKMDALRATRVEVASRVGEKTEEITTLDARIAESKREIVDLHEGGEHVPDDKLDDAFAQLGF
jgi:hypothetical protein